MPNRSTAAFFLAGCGLAAAGYASSAASEVTAATPAAPVQTSAGRAACESLAALELDGFEIVSARTQSAGSVPEGVKTDPKDLTGLPNFCRVVGRARPEQGSNILFEVWLPARGWTGRILGAGNGAFAGSISYGTLAAAVRGGEVGTSTNTGHATADASWGRGRPELVRDFGYRAIHLTAVAGKALSQAFYGRQPDRSYFMSCSNGGRQALMEASRYPEDYDGILAGAPAASWTGLGLTQFHNELVQRAPGAPLRVNQMRFLENEVLNQCDALDGVSDRIVGDPAQCRFDYSRLACGTSNAPECFSPAQITSLKAIVAGRRSPSGAQLTPGFPLSGVESSWAHMVTANAIMIALGNTSIDEFAPSRITTLKDFDWGVHPARMRADVGVNLDASPDLTRFFARGGKLLMFHGWADPAITPRLTLDYYREALRESGPRARSSMRLFMLPGVGHCAGGPGASPLDAAAPPSAGPDRSYAAALREWVEHGRTPERLVGVIKSPGAAADEPAKPVRERLHCAFPATAVLRKGANPDLASSYGCKRT
jgi:feruloyl esterase